MSAQLTPNQLFSRLNSVKGKWKKILRPEMQGSKDGLDADGVAEQCVVSCTKCTRVFSPANPMASYNTHSDATKQWYCKGLQAEDKKKAVAALNELLHVESDDEDLVGVEKVALRSSPRIAKQRSRISVSQEGSMVSVRQEGRAWWPNPAQTSEYIPYFAIFLYTSETPFNKANNRSLKKMGNVVGVTMPNDKVFRTRLLGEAYGKDS